MASKKRKTARKSASKPKVAKKRRSAAKRASGGRHSKSLVAEVVHTLEEIPGKIRKAAKKTRKVAEKSKVVRKLEELPKQIRKAAKKTGWRT